VAQRTLEVAKASSVSSGAGGLAGGDVGRFGGSFGFALLPLLLIALRRRRH